MSAPTPVIERRGAGLIVGTVRSYTMATRHQIPGQWEAYFRAGLQIDNFVPGAMYGVSFSASEDGFEYGVGVEVRARPAALPAGTCVMHLLPGDYAVLRTVGPVARLPEHFDWLFSTWLPGSGHAQREGAVFERYPDEESATPDNMAYEIWVPVTAKQGGARR